MWWQNGIYAVIGVCGGLLVAGGLFAFLALIAVVTRLAAGTTTAKYITFYEDMSLLGCVGGNLLFLYGFSLPMGNVFLGMYGMGAGIFTGCLAAALAEVVNMMPVLSERISLKNGMAGIMAMFALGKVVGSLFGLLR
jgi:stage V sporulation protein AB